MDVLLKSLTQHLSEIVLFLLAAVLVLGFLSVRSLRLHARQKSRWKGLFEGAQGENIESMLHAHLRERVRSEEEIRELRSRIEELETQLLSSKRHVGLVRYDAFEDVGGNQSFALALYDDQGNGAVLNGIVGRTDCRVYCKPLVNGRSERDLSQEEQRAIREARDPRPKSIVSP